MDIYSLYDVIHDFESQGPDARAMLIVMNREEFHQLQEDIYERVPVLITEKRSRLFNGIPIHITDGPVEAGKRIRGRTKRKVT